MFTHVEDFRQRLLRAFPPAPFYGLVSAHDECDEGIALRQELPGKRWDEIPAAFVDSNSSSLPLLTPSALVAFLPAWLLQSIETVGNDNDSVLAEFTMFFLCPGNEDDGWDEKIIAKYVALFDPSQRSVIEEFLRRIADDDALSGWHPWAEYGLKWWADNSTRGNLRAND
jgi:hypothetical protein